MGGWVAQRIDIGGPRPDDHTLFPGNALELFRFVAGPAGLVDVLGGDPRAVGRVLQWGGIDPPGGGPGAGEIGGRAGLAGG